jgi:hypothetical protein
MIVCLFAFAIQRLIDMVNYEDALVKVTTLEDHYDDREQFDNEQLWFGVSLLESSAYIDNYEDYGYFSFGYVEWEKEGMDGEYQPVPSRPCTLSDLRANNLTSIFFES